MLTSLHLRDFKKHQELDVNFTDGLNGVYGANYKGKTTILYGILYALGGSSHVPGSRLARRGGTGRFSVALNMVINGKALRVERTKSTANLYEGEEILATGTTGVNDKLEELIGMSVKQWKELHYAKQKNAHSLLRYSAGNLHSLLRRLVGADDLDAIQARLKRMADREQGVVDGLAVASYTAEECEENLKTDTAKLGEFKATLAQAEEVEAGLQGDREKGLAIIEANTEALSVAQAKKGALETFGARMEAANRGLKQAQDQVAERTQAVEAADTELAKLPSTGDAGERIAAFEAAKRNYERCKERHDESNATLASASEDLSAREQDKVEVDQKAKDLVAEIGTLADLKAELASVMEKKAVAASNYKGLKEAIAGAACPTCKRAFEDHNPEQLQAELETVEAEGKKLAERIQPLSAAIESHEAMEIKVNRATNALAAAKEKFANAEQKLSDTEEDQAEAETAFNPIKDLDVEGLRADCQSFAVATQAFNVAKAELLKAEAGLQAAIESTAALLTKEPKGSLEELTETIAKLTKLLSRDRATLVELRTALEEAQCVCIRAGRDVQGCKERIKVWETNLATVKANSDRRVTAEKRLLKIKHLQKHLKDNSEGYMNKVWGSFLVSASRFTVQCTGGDIEALDRTEDGTFVFTEEGEQMGLDEASGAQEAIIGLAVQMALSSAAPCHLNLLLLDEPTADMDPNCSMATMVAMKALGQQVVFVSHHETDNSLCDNAITL